MATALVTGASGGIGLELARLLAADGHRLALAARSTGQLERVAAELPDATAVTADLSTPEGVRAVREAVGEVDVLVNNAGIGDFGPFAETDPARTQQMIQLNVVALTELTRAYLPGMLAKRSGRVLNVASTASFQPGPLMAVYYATKAYVLSFTEAVAEEVRGSGVTVTALCPGPTATGFQAEAQLEGSKLVRGRTLPTAADVAKDGYRAMLRGDVVYVPGFRNKVLASSVRLTPRPIIRRAVHRIQST
ncbi:MAG: SDR family NAD(P)-dependent oxidoreductase [Ilumatobacteraceae bacterium]